MYGQILHALEVRLARAHEKNAPPFGNRYQLELETLRQTLVSLSTDPSFQRFVADKMAEGW